MPMVCSTCGRDFLLDETEAPPFCSQRCRMIDLGRWLDEEIGVPHEGGPDGGHHEHRPDGEEHENELQGNGQDD
ncbi:MAG: DNA gyrase inhibitor YacG [Pirellulaceae bacterium]